MIENTSGCAVAPPSNATAQPIPANRATGRATSTQPASLKALAVLALERNQPRNLRATDPEKPAQPEGAKNAFQVAQKIGPILVQAWTPNGDMITVAARDQEHAEWIQRMNPPPRRST